MSRLVVVSNRVAQIDEGKQAAGGLAVAVLAALRENGGMWFGWNGEITPTTPNKPDLQQAGKLTYATMGMTRRDNNEYYAGFANSMLWPLFHYRLDLTHFDAQQYQGYRRVNTRFAKALSPLLRKDDVVWVHDYHLIPFAEELRKQGADHKMGFFLHTPLPALEILLALPRHEALMRGIASYDLVGFQTVNDLSAFYDYVVLEAGGKVLDDNVVEVFGRRLRARVFAIGIDTDDVAALARKSVGTALAKRLDATIGDRHLIIGVDRLDYSKGLVQRFQSFERMLERNIDLAHKVTLLQIAPPSRPDVMGYTEIRQELETAAGHINGRFSDFDWVPIRYLNKSFDRAELTCFFRASRIGLVTPLRDGMNLVAKEYVASQDEADPGVLILSRFAGAAHEMTEALIVNPYDEDEVSSAMARAIVMPLKERRERWRKMMRHLETHDIHGWRADFLDTLNQPLPVA